MDEDQILQSIIADPKLTDPSIDVSKLRQTTPTRAELLADVPEFSGLKYDPTQRSYFEDLYTLYGGGAPMVPEPVVETPVVTTPIVDTSVMDQPAGDSVLDTTPTVITPTQTFAGQPATSITPGATIDNVTGDITNPDGSFGGNIVNEFFTPPSGITGDPIDVGIPDNESGFVDPLGTIPGATMVGNFQNPTIGTVDPTKAFITTPLSDVELAEEGFRDPISKVTPPGFEPTVTINETPETFIDKTKNFLGLDNVDLPEFAIKAAINKTVGQPITLAFDLAKDIFSKQTTQDQGVTANDAFDVTNEAAFAGFDAGGFDPATPVDTPDPADDFEVSGDVANVGTTMDLIGPAPVDNIFDEVALTGDDGPDTGPSETSVSEADVEAGLATESMADFSKDEGGTGGGGGKSIVCTAMYQTTGLEDWKKAMKIWYIYQKKYLTIQHQEGYHKLFKPFVKGMHKSKIIKAIGAHIAKHRTQHLKHVMFNSKSSLLGKIYNKILEPICYWVGKHD
jgi:hypothetical protein